MKKLALTLTALCALAALVYAGPEHSTAKEMKEVAPTVAAPACHDWSGFYVGGFGGYKFGNIDTDLDPNGDWDLFPADRDSIRSNAPGDLDTSGAEAGALIGFNWQFHNCWVLGFEADGGYLWLRDSNSSGTFSNPLASDKSIETSFKTTYLFTVAPRIGYSIGNWLPYVTGGLAVGDLQFDQRLHNATSANAGPYTSGGSVEETHAGWMVGGGLQYAFNSRWSVRAQYQYVDLGSVDFQAPGSVGFTTFSTHNRASLTEHNASFAIIYGF
jgi:outer membrane immunogenic protein